jgi:hypothetical protein
MSKGEKRVREESRNAVEGESSSNACVLPSMPKGEIVGKYLIDSELVIDGKYNSEDGMSTGSL